MIIHVKYLICVDNNQLLSSTKEYLYHPLLIPPVRYLITCQTHTSKVVVWIGVEVEEKSWRDLSSSSKSDNQSNSDFRSPAPMSARSSAMNTFNMFADELIILCNRIFQRKKFWTKKWHRDHISRLILMVDCVIYCNSRRWRK